MHARIDGGARHGGPHQGCVSGRRTQETDEVGFIRGRDHVGTILGTCPQPEALGPKKPLDVADDRLGISRRRFAVLREIRSPQRFRFFRRGDPVSGLYEWQQHVPVHIDRRDHRCTVVLFRPYKGARRVEKKTPGHEASLRCALGGADRCVARRRPPSAIRTTNGDATVPRRTRISPRNRGVADASRGDVR